MGRALKEVGSSREARVNKKSPGHGIHYAWYGGNLVPPSGRTDEFPSAALNRGGGKLAQKNLGLVSN